VLHCWANPDGTQKIESTGPLDKKRMETVDEEVTREAIRFMGEAKKAGKPFFLWWNSTRMHIWTRLKAASQGKTGLGIYPDGMVEHDAMVGEVLGALDELGLAQDTIVMYSTDNGAEKFTWPDGGQSPFRGEKNTNWEGGYRVPCAIRWPGVVEPGTVLNDVFAHEDMLPTLLAAAGVPDVKEKLKKGMQVGSKTFKVHLDGYDVTSALAGKSPARAGSSSTSTTTARSSPCATTSGRSSSPSSARMASTCGRSRSCRCACPSSSTCAPTRSRRPTTRAWTTSAGASSTFS
jgi:arylsulfatase